MTSSRMKSPEDLFRRLDELGLSHHTHHHSPLFTVADSKALRGKLPGGHSKNLFLRDKKKSLWLVVAEEDRIIDLKSLKAKLGARGSLSFGSAELLHDVLGVTPGSVTPFALINDETQMVRPLLDSALMQHDPLNFHPLTNEATTAISPGDLLKFISSCGHQPDLLDFNAET